jgi:hypothetical protein
METAGTFVIILLVAALVLGLAVWAGRRGRASEAAGEPGRHAPGSPTFPMDDGHDRPVADQDCNDGGESDMGDYVEVRSRNYAHPQPNFIIRHNGKLYLTVAVLEYDEGADNITREQREDIARVQHLFDSSTDFDRAAYVEMKMGFSFQSTNPPKPPRHEEG